jgi:hypothetical protein
MIEVLPHRAPRRGVQRHVTRLEPLALTDADVARPIVHIEIRDRQGRHFADTQPGL